MKEQASTSLTKGPITQSILLFTGPLIIGNLFQQLYNTADSFIVGNFVGSGALAAIGASAQIINLFIGFIIGLTTGAGIIIAQYYGAGDGARLHSAVHTSFSFCILGGVLVSLAGFLLSPLILTAMNTPAKVIPDAALYLRVYFLGALFNILYNMGAGTLQAAGDTKHPLYYLFLSSAVNVALDILFVTVFRMAVLGAALATLIARLVSAFCVLWKLTHTRDAYRLVPSQIHSDKAMLVKILKFGIPILWLTVMIPLFPSIYTLYLGYPVTWATAALCMGIYYRKRIKPRLTAS